MTMSYMLGNVLDIDYSDDEHATNSEVTEWWHDWQPIDTNLESSGEINASSRVRPRANDTDPRGSNDSNDNHNEEGGATTTREREAPSQPPEAGATSARAEKGERRKHKAPPQLTTTPTDLPSVAPHATFLAMTPSGPISPLRDPSVAVATVNL